MPACDVALDRVEQAPGGAPEPALDVALAATRLASAATRADPEETLACATRAEAALSALAAEAAGPARSPLRCRRSTPTCSRCCSRPRGLAQLATGDLAAAALTLTDAVGGCAEAGFGPEQLANLARLALAEALQGHLHRARELVDAAVALAGSRPGAGRAAPLPAALVVAESWTLVESDDADAARTAMLEPLTPMEPDEQVVVDALLSVLRSRVGRARKTDEAALAAARPPTGAAVLAAGPGVPGAVAVELDGRAPGGGAVGRRGPAGPRGATGPRVRLLARAGLALR